MTEQVSNWTATGAIRVLGVGDEGEDVELHVVAIEPSSDGSKTCIATTKGGHKRTLIVEGE